jgi:DNA-binding NarL/FixJ family response regulator
VKQAKRARSNATARRTSRDGEQEATRLFRMRLGDEALLVLSRPAEPVRPEGLTVAQFEVALAIARGASNADIARERGTSVRTIANQVAAIFKCLGVGSRFQVAAAISRSRPRT